MDAIFERQAEACERMGSPLTAQLCRVVAKNLASADGPVFERLRRWSPETARDDAVPLRFAGALHGLVLAGAAGALSRAYPPASSKLNDDDLWRGLAAAVSGNEDTVLTRLDHPPQTNEVLRSAILMPGFLTIAEHFKRPLSLVEIGASAGLNMGWDRYGYRYGSFSWGDIDAQPLLTPRWDGPPPPTGEVEVVGRRGCDQSPLDLQSPVDREWLLSFIWADQSARLERTKAAIAVSSALRPDIQRCDAVTFIQQALADRVEGAVTIVYHSIVWQYLGEEDRAAFTRTMDQFGDTASQDAPIAWLRFEPDGREPGAAVSLQVWPDGGSWLLGRADYHGHWINWYGTASGGTKSTS